MDDEGGGHEFRPLFSIKVDKTYAPIQGFGLYGHEVPSFIDELSEDAVATVSGWEKEASRAGRRPARALHLRQWNIRRQAARDLRLLRTGAPRGGERGRRRRPFGHR